MTESPGRPLARLPKADLHVHLEGAMRHQTYVDLSRKYGQQPSSLAHYPSFEVFHHTYRSVVSLIRTPDDLRRLVREMVSDAARCGVIWIEPQFNPLTYAPCVCAQPDEVLDLVIDAAEAAAGRHGVSIGFMLSASRHRDPRDAVAIARLAARYAGRGVVSFGLVGDESVDGISEFAEAFAIARRADLVTAPHAGEFGSPRRILRTLEALNPDRIAHGIRAALSRAVMKRLADCNVTLDVCLTSNIRLGAIGRIEDHPLPVLMANEIPCSLGSDDPLLLKTDVLAEYEVARARLSMTDNQLAALALASVSAAAAPIGVIRQARDAIGAWLSRESGNAARHGAEGFLL